MTTFMWVYLIAGAVIAVPMILVQALHPNPWVRKQVENVYGPGFVMGWCFGMMIGAMLKA